MNVLSERTLSPCLTADVSYDKWELLNGLIEAAPAFGLSHRALSVLRALLTFLPDREIENTPNSAIVFPANKTLSMRLGGMPESTLRRHLAALVATGIVSRHDSPNKKRFARRVKGATQLSFGFDLSPLAANADEIFSAAEKFREQEERKSALRVHINYMRAELANHLPADHHALTQSRLILRRKVAEHALIDLIKSLQDEVEALKKIELESKEMSDSHSQNERHIYSKEDTNLDSEKTKVQNQHQKKETSQSNDVSLGQVLDNFAEYRSLFPQPISTWQALIDISQKLAPMIAIEPIVLFDAQKKMGAGQAAVCILYILEKFAKIKNPNGYLRKLAKDAQNGLFSVVPLLSNGGQYA